MKRRNLRALQMHLTAHKTGSPQGSREDATDVDEGSTDIEWELPAFSERERASPNL